MVPRKEPDLSTYSGRFAARLRELRDKNHLSAIEVAEACGVAQRTIHSWEAGSSLPSYELLPVISIVYKLKTPRLLLPKE